MKTLGFKTISADHIGILSASLCVVHCLLTPVLLVIASKFSWWHELSYLFLALSLWAVIDTTKGNTPLYIKGIIWGFYAALTLCILLEEGWELAYYMSYAASIGLVVGHVLNVRHCRKCELIEN